MILLFIGEGMHLQPDKVFRRRNGGLLLYREPPENDPLHFKAVGAGPSEVLTGLSPRRPLNYMENLPPCENPCQNEQDVFRAQVLEVYYSLTLF